MEKMQMYHTDSIAADVNAFKRALVMATSLAAAASVDVVYLCGTLQNLNSDAAEKVIGQENLKAFKKHKVITINGVPIRLETARKRVTNQRSVMFAPYLSLKAVRDVLADYRTADLVFVPWSDTERKQYLIDYPASVKV